MKEKPSLPGLLILVSLLTVSLLQANDDVQDPVTVIEVNAASDLVSRHASTIIIDVRTPLEYEMSHITGYIAWKNAELPLVETSD
jgi:hypothetical protein